MKHCKDCRAFIADRSDYCRQCYDKKHRQTVPIAPSGLHRRMPEQHCTGEARPLEDGRCSVCKREVPSMPSPRGVVAKKHRAAGSEGAQDQRDAAARERLRKMGVG